ncbi:wall-associated receptor kinase 17-like isoform X1 [Elaeis guineensis]|uniref:Wall-associated receptor kinase 3-like n=1 Tax=Elaeis guineensis var. tenera TaxID=51953 RepID=A0A6J0PHJ8_ELAGV|nr:wall-associated receptor kinase 3-like [Elaeis guineensis]
MISRLLLILELLLLLAASLGTYKSKAKNPSFPLSCTSVPYPFGMSGKAMEGFEISCNGTSPILRLGERTYRLADISLPQGYLSIYTGAIFQICDMDFTSGSGWINLTGTPYTISDTQNALTMVGCNYVAIISSEEGFVFLTTSSLAMVGCVTYCPSVETIVSGSCSGLGCCQASIPKGLKSFNILYGNIDSFQNSTAGITYCRQAFFANKGSFTFSRDKLLDGVYHKQFSQDGYLMTLDWAIGNDTCEEARRKKETNACKENSYCYDSTNGFGYRCNCSQGYHGNPYIGCTDINECEDPELNPCVGLCINEPGNVSCACPPGQHGDGRKQGSGCTKKEKDTAFPLELALGAGLSILFILIIGSLLFYWVLKKRKLIKMKAKFFQQNGGLFLRQQILSQGSNAIVKIFSIEDLEKATNNFNESQILGCGGYGTVYKGVLPSQKVVAIKKSKLVDGSQLEQFINEIVILSQINHKNVVRLLGCCLETQVPLLVYEFISNGTLFHHIHGQCHDFSMPWEVRLRIAAEAAGALAYLHSTTSVPIIHRDVKSTNILLDENYRAKVSDFGASRSVPFDQTHITTIVQGTFGYLDPEYFHTSKLTEKSDVYSFGVVLVELLTREFSVSHARSEDHRNLATYFILMFDELHLLQLIDPQILEEVEMEKLLVVAQLARRCLNLKGEERPTMKEVAIELEGLRRFPKQQLAPQNPEKMEHLLGGIGPSNGCTEEATRQYSLEDDMLASMDLPR